MSRASSHHNWGNLGYRSGVLGPVLQPHRLHRHPRQPGQLGRLALGRHPRLRLLLAAGQPGALRPARGRATQHRAHHLTGATTPTPPTASTAAPIPPSGACGCGTRASRQIFIDPVLQLHRGARGRQVDRLPARHHVRPGPGHRLRVARRRHLRQGVRRHPHASASRSSRTTSSARSDGVPKTPALGRGDLRRPARTIVALAREWASHRTCSGRRHQGRRRRRLPSGLRHRVRPGMHGLPAGHAGPGQAGRQHLGDGQRAAVQPHAGVPRLRAGRLQPHRREAGRQLRSSSASTG